MLLNKAKSIDEGVEAVPSKLHEDHRRKIIKEDWCCSPLIP